MFKNISPKANGAWLGAGTGVTAGSIAVGLIEYYGHTSLPLPLVTLIDGAASGAVSYLGAWLMPLLSGLTTKAVAEQLALPPVINVTTGSTTAGFSSSAVPPSAPSA